MRSDQDRVLAIMAKAPRAGHVKTRLAPMCQPDWVIQLYRAMIEDTIALGRAVGAGIAIICPAGDAQELVAWLGCGVRVETQSGQGLAEGLASAFELLCAPGRCVIAIQGDGPHLPVGVLEDAFAALASSDIVVGPCEDGGFYLVGGTRAHDVLFDASAMGSRGALGALLTRARRGGLTAAVTAEHYDVDVPEDLTRLARELSRRPERAPRTAEVLAGW
jgi:uncharacterized protein